MLNPYDDYPIHQTGAPLHQPATGDRNHYDRYFFNGYDRDGDLFFAAAMGLYPNRSVIDAAFSVVDGGVQRNVHASGRAPDVRTDTSCGPVRIEIVEPMREIRVIVDGPDTQGIACDLTWRARTVALEEDRFLRTSGSRTVMDYTRMTQFGTWEGTVHTGAREVAISPDTHLGSRDRSWGIRSIGEPEGGAPGRQLPQFFWLWAPLNFEDGASHFDVNEESNGRRWHQTAVRVPLLGEADPVDPGGRPHSAEPMRDVDWHIDWQPGTRRAASASLTFTPWNAEPSTIELEPLLTFQMLGIGYFHPEWSHGVWKGESAVGVDEWVVDDLDPTAVPHVHVQQLVRATWGDRQGIGVLEQLAIGAHEPSGLSGLFDGA